MSWADWLLVCDAAALAVASAAFVWVGSVAWSELAKPRASAVQRPASWFGERSE